MNKFTVPDICDEHGENIKICDLFLNSYGKNDKFYGQVETARCEHSNSIVKELVAQNGSNKVLVIQHTGTEKCSMVGDQIAQTAFENNISIDLYTNYQIRKNNFGEITGNYILTTPGRIIMNRLVSNILKV